jgi:hypothetical protein
MLDLLEEEPVVDEGVAIPGDVRTKSALQTT